MISERDVIYITKKQASIALVALATFCILIFMLGYFWGKQSMLDGFGQRITQESMNDQADYESMMQSFADRAKSDTTLDFDSNDSALVDSLQEDVFKNDLPDIHEQFKTNEEHVAVVAPVVNTTTPANKTTTKGSLNTKKSNKSTAATSTPKKWSAVLVGFATKQSALSFVQRLQNRGISVQIRTRISKSANGKAKKMWFQVVTLAYDSKEELDDVITQIKKTERLKSSDIKIN